MVRADERRCPAILARRGAEIAEKREEEKRGSREDAKKKDGRLGRALYLSLRLGANRSERRPTPSGTRG
jgi:hypothetical protein